jgi:hypothetical protein
MERLFADRGECQIVDARRAALEVQGAAGGSRRRFPGYEVNRQILHD